MKCPACNTELVPMHAGNIEVDVCRDGCGGLWFDKDEIKNFDSSAEPIDQSLLQQSQQRRLPGKAVKPCPKCEGEVLIRQFFDVENEVEIDQCWNCSGIWLDVGELQKIRNQFKTDQDRSAKVNEYVSAVLTQTKVALREHSKAEVDRYDEQHRNRVASVVTEFGEVLRSLLGRSEGGIR